MPLLLLPPPLVASLLPRFASAADVQREWHDNSTIEEEEEEDANLFYLDDLHPQGGTGHRALADLVIHLTRQAATDLGAHPLGREDEEVAQVGGRAGGRAAGWRCGRVGWRVGGWVGWLVRTTEVRLQTVATCGCR